MVLSGYMHGLTPYFHQYLSQGQLSPGQVLGLSIVQPLFALIIGIVLIWTIILKGFSLWYAARGSQKWWFIALLIINTLGILEIVYLIWFRPKAPEHHAPSHHSSATA